MTKPIDLEPAGMEAARRKGRELAGNQPGALIEAFAEVAAAGAAAYLSAARSAPEAGKAVVKPLEWDAIREVVNEPWAKSTVRQSIGRHNLGPYAGSYSVQEMTRDGDWGWWTTWEASREPQGICKTEAEAKAAAQQDFERRILSALASVPAPSGAIDELIAIDEVDRDMIARGDRIGADLQRALLNFYDGHAIHSSEAEPMTKKVQHRLRPHKKAEWGPWTDGHQPKDYLGWFELRDAPQAVPAEVAGLIERLKTPTEGGAQGSGDLTWLKRNKALRDEAAAALSSISAERDRLRQERDWQYDENVNRIAAEGAAILRAEASEAEATSLRRKLGELLAVIHRDGGHYQDFAGTEQAVADAQSAVVLLFQAQDERNDLRRKLEEAERQRDEVIRKSAAYNPTEREGRAIMDEAAAIERAEAAERKLEEYRKALEPFAAAKGHFDGHVRDEDTVEIALRHIRAHHVRAAARALSGASE